jgi:tRNA uridine 5-carboxymethylaminomethyl modification enzyme
VTEPYRMFTSRAEYRLTLRADNADRRLTDRGAGWGLVGAERRLHWEARRAALAEATAWAKDQLITPDAAALAGIRINRDGVRRSLFDLLAYPSVAAGDIGRLVDWPQTVSAAILERVEIDAKYAVYAERQQRDIEDFRRSEGQPIPQTFDFAAVAGFSNEVRQKLDSIRPRSIGQAQRIDGMTPAAITLLLAALRKQARLERAG